MGVADSAFGEAGWVGRMPFPCVFQFPLVEGHQLSEAPGYEHCRVQTLECHFIQESDKVVMVICSLASNRKRKQSSNTACKISLTNVSHRG